MKFKTIHLVVTSVLVMLTMQVGQAAEVKSAEKNLLVKELVENILNKYVYKDHAEKIVKGLQELAGSKQFEKVNDTYQLANMLSEKLGSYDSHFNVSWVDPDLKVAEKPLQETWESSAKRNNYGFETIKLLTGNIGYLDLRFFDGTDNGKKRADAAMTLFENNAALIIDLRHNGGGSPEMVQYLSSYFFDPKNPVHLNSLYWREGDQTTEFWSQTDLPGTYLPEIPIFILISPRTASAAEEFAYNMSNLKRATLIGETTLGGANPGNVFALSNYFSVFISTGAAINPISQTNWEKVGVKPTIEVDSLMAFDLAYQKSLELVSQQTSNHWLRNEIQWKLEELNAEKQIKIQTPAYFESLAGEYGSRKIIFENGGLYYRNNKRMKQRMIHMGGEVFALADSSGMRLRVLTNNDTSEQQLSIEMVSGAKFLFAKSN